MKRWIVGASTLVLAVWTSATLAAVTLPYSYTAGQTVKASEVNANESALLSGINNHLSGTNPHSVSLQQALAINNSAGSYSINFNLNPANSFRVENVSADPACGTSSRGRLIWNTTDSLYKICNGSSFVSIAGSGVNTLQSVLSAGNSAGSSNINVNENQLLGARVENLTSDPSFGNIGRLFYNTTSNALKVDTGGAIQTIGGAQGLSSVLSTSNSAGSTNIDFNGNQAVKVRLEQLASDPGTTYTGRIYYNTTSNKARFYDGTTWKEVGNTNTLSDVLALGNLAATNIDFNQNQAVRLRLENLSGAPGTGTAGRLWYNTATAQVEFETAGASNRAVCTLDDTQTITNKSMSGSSNTFTNIPDSALSANVQLLNGTQTVSGAKTFSAAPTISNIKTTSGTSSGHLIPNGLSDDTFVLANAVQTLSGKTLSAPTLSGNLDFNYNQASKLIAETAALTPASGHAGRIFYKSSTGELVYDDGTKWNVIASSTGGTIPTLAQVLGSGNSLGGVDLNFNNQQALAMRAENLGSDPGAARVGRVFYNTTGNLLKVDTGTLIKSLVDTDTVQTLTNKTISGSSNTLSNIAPSSLTALTANRALVSDGSGVVSPSAVTSTTLGFLDATSSVQTQLNGKQATGNFATSGSGDVAWSAPAGAGPVTTAIGASKVTNAMLAGSIASSKLVGSDIATVGTVTTGTWSATAIAETKGGTNQTSYTLGDVLYASAANTLSKRAGNTSATPAGFYQTGTGTVSAAPVWQIIPSARYTNATATVTGSGSKVTYTTVDYDTNSAYVSGVYTVPTGAAGRYQINAGAIINATYTAGQGIVLSIVKNGTAITTAAPTAPAFTGNLNGLVYDCVNLAAGDTIQIFASSSGTTPTLTSNGTYNFFSIVKVSP